MLSRFSGYPELPNGLPTGVWAFMVANDARPMTYAQAQGGEVRRLPHRGDAPSGETLRTLDVPWLNPRSSRPAELVYAAIETDPAGIFVATFPKGAQDLIVRSEGARLFVELGQKTSLLALLRHFGAQVDLDDLARFTDPLARRAAELSRLHERAVAILLARGYDVEMESVLEAGIRETREEHGFDLCRESARVRHIDVFIEHALSKRRPGRPIAHRLYAARVSDFEETLPCVSLIREEKNPAFEGRIYREQGAFLTLPQMWQRLAQARALAAASTLPSNAACFALELEVTESRLRMLERIERTLTARLCRQGIVVTSRAGPGPEADIVDSLDAQSGLPETAY